jgi:glycosyltransferase involved in cell wall biosynthesis
MHILFVSHSADLLGAERNLLTLVEAAIACGHRVSVTAPVDGPLGDALRTVGASVLVVPTRSWMGKRFNPVVGSIRLAQALWSVRRYQQVLRDLRPDLVVTNSAVVPAGALAARRLGVPHVWMVQESVLTNPTLRSALPRRTVVRVIAASSRQLVVLSQYTADQVVAAAPAATGKLAIIPPKIAAEAYPPPVRRSDGPLRDLVLFGRVSVEKGQLEAIRAIARCAERGAHLRLTLAGVGDGPAAASASRLAAELGVADQLRLVPWTDDPGAFYHQADATLMLSRNEAYGRVTVESLLTGTPVVGYDAGGTSELLAQGGGVLVAPGVEQLAAALTALAGDPSAMAQLRAEAAQRGRLIAASEDPAVAAVRLLERTVAVPVP